MERIEKNTKPHRKQKQRLHRQPDAYELYELEHKPYELTKARSVQAGPQAHPIFTSDDYNYEMEIEVRPHWHPTEGGNGVILRPDDYEARRNMPPYWSSPENDDGGCNGNVDCEAEKFIMLEHDKFELSNWKSSMKK